MALSVCALARAVLPQICRIAVGLTVGLVAHLLEGLPVRGFLRRISRAHKAEQAFHIGTGLDVDQSSQRRYSSL